VGVLRGTTTPPLLTTWPRLKISPLHRLGDTLHTSLVTVVTKAAAVEGGAEKRRSREYIASCKTTRAATNGCFNTP
jgi:hypothetical protein